MRLENILALTQGSLKNNPFITSFDGISYRAKRVKRGDLFIAVDPDTITEAILNGAYGIIFDKPTQISDNEIAWIKVESVDNAMLRLLRFRLIEKNPEVYRCDPITLKLAAQLRTPDNLILLSSDLIETFRKLWDCEAGSLILYHPDQTSSDLFTSSEEIPDIKGGIIEIIEQTLFETSFIYNNIFYERQLLSPFFVPYLQRLLNFLGSRTIQFNLRTFKPIDHFEAVFTNNSLEPRAFGGTDKVLIFEPDFKLVDLQIEFLNTQANWAKIIYVVPETRKQFLEEIPNIFYYHDQAEIIEILRNSDFHFALIAEQKRSILEKHDKDNQPEQLFLDL